MKLTFVIDASTGSAYRNQTAKIDVPDGAPVSELIRIAIREFQLPTSTTSGAPLRHYLVRNEVSYSTDQQSGFLWMAMPQGGVIWVHAERAGTRVTFLDQTGAKAVEAVIADGVTVKRILPNIITSMGLWMIGPDGQPMSYSLDHKEGGKRLREDQTLPAAQVSDGDHLIVYPEIVAGGYDAGQIIRSAHFSVFAPEAVAPGETFVLEVIAYSESERESALQIRRKKSVEVGRKVGVQVRGDLDIHIHVECPGLIIQENEDVINWWGGTANASFVIEVPLSAQPKSYVGVARMVAHGIQIARLPFTVSVEGAAISEPDTREFAEKTIRSVFASYASQDRVEVLKWRRGAEALGARVFVDVAKLREGENWGNRLVDEIRLCDLFCLFWSPSAAKSEWVEKEWRQALREKGCSFIYPVALTDPRDTPPPTELGACLHFEDMMRIGIEYEQFWRAKQL